MIRPMTSNVSALSGIVANGHQAVHFVSSAPSKIPYGGFSPVRLQTGCQPRPSLHPQLIRGHSGDLFRARWFRSRTCVRRHSRLLTPHTCPVALGSAGGFAVHQPHRLLWPHPSFCAAPPVSYFISGGSSATQKVPTFICQSLMTCRRPYSDGPGESRTNLNSRHGLRPFGRGSATMQTKSNQIKPNQTKSNQIKPNQTKSLWHFLMSDPKQFHPTSSTDPPLPKIRANL